MNTIHVLTTAEIDNKRKEYKKQQHARYEEILTLCGVYNNLYTLIDMFNENVFKHEGSFSIKYRNYAVDQELISVGPDDSNKDKATIRSIYIDKFSKKIEESGYYVKSFTNNEIYVVKN